MVVHDDIIVQRVGMLLPPLVFLLYCRVLEIEMKLLV